MPININPSQYRFLDNAKTTQGSNKTSETAKALTESLQKALPGVTVGDKQSPEETARNILRHVENGLNQLRAQGADAGRLQERLDAAKAGIDKGYAEATEMLKGLGMLDDNLKEQIAAGRKLVDQGVEALANNIKNPTSANSLVAASSSLKVANSMTLEVLTRDGDRVKVSFAQTQSTSSNTSADAFSMSSSASIEWKMDVVGNLSQAETEALSTLFNDVQNLSERFFAGDLGKALEQAMNLGYDASQLASLSLNLTQQTTSVSTRAYSQFKPELPTPELESLKAPLASYVDSYARALEKANPLADAVQTLRDIMQKMLPEESRMPIWKTYTDALNQLLAAQQSMSKA